MAQPQTTYPPRNRILAALPRAEFDRFSPNLQSVSLTLRQALHEVRDPLEWVYFIEEGVASILTTMTNGSTIEVGMIGVGSWAQVVWWLVGAVMIALAVLLWQAETHAVSVRRSHHPV